ncbi:MAG: LUD domain-containing protein [Gammaproteobacteria bacterium]
MTGSREAIMHSIRLGLGRGELSADKREKLESRLSAGEANSLRPQLAKRDLPDLFREGLERMSGQLTELADRTHIPAEVAHYLQMKSISGRLVVAPVLQDMDWKDCKSDLHFGRAEGDETVGISQAYCGIAETGSVVLLSAPDNPTTINFLPDHHLVVLHKADLVSHMEDAWTHLRNDRIHWPRTVNIIAGPSRTADIEQTIQLGAHGPRWFHVLLTGIHK